MHTDILGTLTKSFFYLAKVLCGLIEWGSLTAIIIYSNTETCLDMDFESVVLMAVAVIIMGSKAGILSTVCDKMRFLPWLGKFSLMLYLNHMYWIWIFNDIGFQMEYSTMLALYFAWSCLCALLCWFVVDIVQKMTKQWCRPLLVEQ